MYNVSIPSISSEELLRRYNKIKPIVEVDGKKYFLREFSESELSNSSYIWDVENDKREIVNMDEYTPLTANDFECIHSYGYYGLFKPSIKEVLAQIPEELSMCVDAFEIIQYPKNAEDLNKNKIVFNNGFHMSKVRLYIKR